MDIFTTYLTRVVPIPIKPANLKVKALLKDAATGELKEDLDHVENHDYYFDEKSLSKNKKYQQDSKQEESTEEKQTKSNETADDYLEEKQKNTDAKDRLEIKDNVKHLDLYI